MVPAAKANADGTTTVWFGSEGSRRAGSQLGPDMAGQGLQRDLPALRTARGVVRQDAGGRAISSWSIERDKEHTHESHAMSHLHRACRALVVTSAYAETPDSVKTRIGDLNFERGFPPRQQRPSFSTRSTSSAPSRPICGPIRRFRSSPIRVGFKRDLGVDYNDVAIADSFSGPEGVWYSPPTTPRSTRWQTSISARGRSSSRSRPGRSSAWSKTSGSARSPTWAFRVPTRARAASSSSCHPATRARFRRPATSSSRAR